MAILPICRYADIGDCRYAEIADIFTLESVLTIQNLQKSNFDPYSRQYFGRYFADMAPNADIEKKCRYADIADADINISTPLFKIYPTLTISAQTTGLPVYICTCQSSGSDLYQSYLIYIFVCISPQTLKIRVNIIQPRH